jgi:phospholipase C
VFLVVMENKSYGEAMAVPYTAQLASQYQVATGYHAVSHPSLPNYLALAGGSTYGITDDGYHPLPAGGIGHQLSGAGIPWRAYMEGMTAGCINSPSPYALKHNPFAYFGGACPPEVVPFTRLDQDLAGPAEAMPHFAWVTPDLCHDTHDCPVAEGDRFLQGLVPRILASDAWRQGGVLYLVWDEDDGSSQNLVPALVVAAGETVHTVQGAYDHYSLLAAVEDRLGVGRLGQAAGAHPLNPI